MPIAKQQFCMQIRTDFMHGCSRPFEARQAIMFQLQTFLRISNDMNSYAVCDTLFNRRRESLHGRFRYPRAYNNDRFARIGKYAHKKVVMLLRIPQKARWAQICGKGLMLVQWGIVKLEVS